MAEFTPINTQEEFDERLKGRLERERATIRKEMETKLADYEAVKASLAESDGKLTEAAEKISGYETQIGELSAKVRKYETASVKTRIGLAAGLPLDIIDRLSGETEDEIQADADKLSALIKGGTRRYQYDPEAGATGKTEDAAYLDVLRKLHK